jgi:hypothetical protein
MEASSAEPLRFDPADGQHGTWHGEGAPSPAEWDALASEARDLMFYQNSSFNADLSRHNVTGIADNATDIRALVEAIENGFTVSELREVLDMQMRASRDYANGDSARGRDIGNVYPGLSGGSDFYCRNRNW